MLCIILFHLKLLKSMLIKMTYTEDLKAKRVDCRIPVIFYVLLALIKLEKVHFLVAKCYDLYYIYYLSLFILLCNHTVYLSL